METPRRAAATLLTLLPLLLIAQSAAIRMDGLFDDWSPALTTFTDPDLPSTGIDLQRMQVTNDDQYLYIRLEVGSEIDLQDDLVPQTIRLYIDGDNSAATGLAAQSGYGAELQIRFDTRTVTEYWGASSNVSWSTIDLVPLPTTTGTSFEIAIARNAVPDGSHALFTSNTIKLLFRETDGGDAMPNTGSTFNYTFSGAPVPALVPTVIAKEDAALVRVVAWNVLADGITTSAKEPSFQRILTALQPDVIGFAECVSSTAAQVKARLDAWLPLGGSGWHVVKDDYDMVIAARWPIVQSWPTLTRQFAALIDLPAAYAKDLLFTAAHLHCCTADQNRQNEADEYVRFVQDAKTSGGAIDLPFGTPMVYAGDLNTVGWAQQLSTLLTGDIQNNATYGPDGAMDWDGTDITAAGIMHTDARMGYTWRNNSSAYPSGRLDHLLYTDEACMLAKSFSLRTEIIPAATLQANGLQSADAGTASDHFPIASDLVIPAASIQVQARCLLEGPYVQALGLMHDSLRVRGLLPLQEPYSTQGLVPANSGAIIGTSVLSATGSNAIVDWVLVELRQPGSPATVLHRRAALLQRDGDIVDLDGLSPPTLGLTPANYLVAVRHRNHLGCMTANTVSFLSGSGWVDFSAPSTSTYGQEACKPMGTAQVLWAGNVLMDNALRYVGEDNDRDPILVRVGGSVPTATATGYLPEDTNLDGTVRYVGQGNDRDPILVNIGGSIPTSTRAEQLP